MKGDTKERNIKTDCIEWKWNDLYDECRAKQLLLDRNGCLVYLKSNQILTWINHSSLLALNLTDKC